METPNLEQALTEYVDRLSDVMVNKLFQNKSFKTGNLARSIQNDNTVKDTPNGPMATLTMEWYGKVVDSGVFGSTNNQVIANPRSANSPGKFKHKAIAKISGLPAPVRFAVAQRGFNAKPFIKDSFEVAQRQFGDQLIIEAGYKDIENSITTAFQNSTK